MTAEKKYTDDVTRRGFMLKAGAGIAALAGCGPQQEPTAPKPAKRTKADRLNPNLFDVLGRFQIYGQDGAEINVEALKAADKDKYITFSVGFAGCGNDTCKATNQTLATLGDSDNIVHYVFNLNPEWEGGLNDKNPESAQKTRDAFPETLRNWGLKGKIVPLYAASTQDVKQIQDDIGTFTIPGGKAQEHGADIVLFAPGGNLPTSDEKDRNKWRKDGVNGDLSGWKELIQRERGR